MRLRDLDFVPGSVPRTATFEQATRALAEASVAAIAVVDGDRVVGLLSEEDVLRGLFPGYLSELRHTAFLEGADAPHERLVQRGEEPVEKHMSEPVVVDADASPAHVAERFFHTKAGAVAVVERDRFVGMLDQSEFTKALLRALGCI